MLDYSELLPVFIVPKYSFNSWHSSGERISFTFPSPSLPFLHSFHSFSCSFFKLFKIFWFFITKGRKRKKIFLNFDFHLFFLLLFSPFVLHLFFLLSLISGPLHSSLSGHFLFIIFFSPLVVFHSEWFYKCCASQTSLFFLLDSQLQTRENKEEKKE